MGLLFTVVYIITAYLAPVTVWGDLASYHIEIIIVSLALLFSIFSSEGSNVMKLPQTWAIFGVVIAVGLSIAIGKRWPGGAPPALLSFIPDVATFFLIVMNCKKKWHLQVLAMTLFFCAAFTIYRAMYDWSIMYRQSDYLLGQKVGEDLIETLVRIKGRSFLGDPNDFAQFMVSLIPMMFLFWQKGSSFRNLLLVYVPCGVLFYGMYQTHSRGSMVALMALCIVAFRKKIGIVPSIVGGLMFFALLTVGGFSGGRDVSAGEDRMNAWATGLLLIRTHPIFGVGYQMFPDYNEITAHNTFVVCAAELGLLGVYFWILTMFVTVRNAWETAKDPAQREMDLKAKEDAAIAAKPFLQGMPGLTEAKLAPAAVSAGSQMNQFATAGAPFILPPDIAKEYAENANPYLRGVMNPEMDKLAEDAEVRRMNELMFVSFVGFLTAGWFLSRAYTMCIYTNAGIAAALYRMAQDRGIAPPPLTFGEASKWSWKVIFALLVIVEIIVKVDHYLPH